MTLLLTWSDRGAASLRPTRHRRHSDSDCGPVLRLLQQPESADKYDHAVVLSPKSGRAAATLLIDEMRAHVANVELVLVDLPDPSDYERVFTVTREFIRDMPDADDVDVLLSAGTPQIQTTWVLLVKAGLLSARMLQVIPPSFVPNPHPKPIKWIDLDFEGFPEILALRDEVKRLRSEVEVKGSALVGSSAPMRALRRLIARVAQANVPVIICGETGTGKELVARAIHRASDRAAAPSIAENCGAFAEGVLQSELFGHERGAFTGASRERRGLFEQAHGGTLFLDEVGELFPRVQSSLLRALQEGMIRRVGGEKEIRVDVRIVAATHRDLRSMMGAGAFREDLFYRLRGAELNVAPLRDRSVDIPELVEHFLSTSEKPLQLSGQVQRALLRYPWPGNVRELRAEVLRWTVFSEDTVRFSDLSPELRGQPHAAASDTPARGPAIRSLRDVVQTAEDEAIQVALAECQGNISQTAKSLNIDRNTLKKKMERMGLR